MSNHPNRPCYPIIFVPDGVKSGKFQPLILPSESNESTRLGASELEFGKILQHHFGSCASSQQQFSPPCHDRPYSADFVVVEPNTNLHIDLEIDEPFSFSGEQIHCVGMDDYRNKCFVDANWIVLRFAEEQVKSQPLRCLRVLANLIARYTNNTTSQELFQGIERLTPIWQWTQRKSKKLSGQNYRKQYL
ncbi:hypothetical protein FNW02_32990 [Komarekiella sp. 'clone 1']|uniref:Uncharacterized protein n=1 Tax=Komarekiella delphini-convector SJRDD-AB1 TaxID=2593771 RepID=A0AA40T4F8_9NOST|nr:hypothetical protein [Komarekiella delphini-convector]MBD6620469.1 hypothetical protein [Komarekiella delphini-convector SJRDD-AB1]